MAVSVSERAIARFKKSSQDEHVREKK